MNGREIPESTRYCYLFGVAAAVVVVAAAAANTWQISINYTFIHPQYLSSNCYIKMETLYL